MRNIISPRSLPLDNCHESSMPSKLSQIINKMTIKPKLLIVLSIIVSFISGATVSIFLLKEIVEERIQTTNWANFIIMESKDEIKFYDKAGNEILIIDKR